MYRTRKLLANNQEFGGCRHLAFTNASADELRCDIESKAPKQLALLGRVSLGPSVFICSSKGAAVSHFRDF